MKVKIAGVLLCCMGFAACRQGQRADETVRWQQVDPLTKMVESKGIKYTITLQTAEQMAYLRAYDATAKRLDSLRYTEELDQTRGHYYFVIVQQGAGGRNVLEQDAHNTEEYSKRYQYYQTEAQQDMYLSSCSDTLAPDAYLYENNMGIVAENRMIAAFPMLTDTCDIQLIFHDRAFDNYLLKARFSYNDIKNAPKAKQHSL